MAEVRAGESFNRPLIIHSIRPLRLPMITGVPVSPSAWEGPDHHKSLPDESLRP